MARSRVIYIGVFLTDESHGLLASDATHEKVFAHHLTVAFRPGMDQEGELSAFLGRQVEMEVQGWARDEKGEAVLVKLPDWLADYCQNDYPHVTVSCAEGVKPVYSNDLLAEADDAGSIEPRGGVLVGRLGFFLGSRVDFGD